jgi:serine/threonine protein kinase
MIRATRGLLDNIRRGPAFERSIEAERQVALKTPHFTEDPTGEQLERFFREARAAGNLRHQNICPIHDFGQIDGRHFITMAYIEGRPLSAFIQPDKQQTERQILILIRKLALALQEAHDHGIVHRDLKPANIMVDKNGEPIIMDFGLARQARRDEDIRLTQSGMLVGTPAYMSPEQVEGELGKIRAPTDEYSLGVILYELLTGQLPFRGSIAAVMGQIITREPPPPGQLRPDLDPRIEAVCMKMMSKNPTDRFPSLSAVAEELATILKRPAAKATSKEKPASSSATSPAANRMRADVVASRVLNSLKPKAVTESDLASLAELARKCYSRHDFEQVIQIIERIPEEGRNAGVQALLEEARAKADEISFLICEIDEALRFNDRRIALKKAAELLKIKPGQHRALQVQEQCAGYGEERAARLGPLRLFTQPWNEGGWVPWSVLAFGVAVFGAMLFYVTVSLRSGKSMPTVKFEERDNEASRPHQVPNIQPKRADEMPKPAKVPDIQPRLPLEAPKPAVVAEIARKHNEEQPALTPSGELRSGRKLYASQMELAREARNAGDVKRVMELLEGQRPQPGQPDLRRIDWYDLWRVCHGERLTLPIQDHSVHSVAISPDGKTLATAGDADRAQRLGRSAGFLT